ncbi:MAG: ATP-dependent DNA ligase [Anaerolineae bacterium]|nr:ATP-dependent DNA ligase [Phycisphaerae bacterium]
MALPIKKTFEPMNALLIDEIPTGDRWQFEPKWDGFRCLAFRDGDKIDLQSKSGQSLTRYFPEVVEMLRAVKAKRFILDGEIVIPDGHELSFDALLQRIHPAATRIRKLSVETPAMFIVFDMLADAKGKSLTDLPLAKRRAALESFASQYLDDDGRIALSPATRDRRQALRWFSGVGTTLDGVIAKRLDLPYQSGNRHGMVKVKRMRTADCVVGGFRYASQSKEIGSLLLGLYNGKGLLDHVGFCSAFKASERKLLATKFEPLIKPPGFTGAAPGGPSRWSTERTSEWKPLAPKVVVEVRFDHFTGGRFRHGTKFLRWRPDKSPRQCLMKQVAHESTVSPLKLLGRPTRRRKAS